MFDTKNINNFPKPPIHARFSIILLPLILFYWISLAARERDSILLGAAGSTQTILIIVPAIIALLACVLTWRTSIFKKAFSISFLICSFIVLLSLCGHSAQNNTSEIHKNLTSIDAWYNFLLPTSIILTGSSVAQYLFKIFSYFSHNRVKE